MSVVETGIAIQMNRTVQALSVQQIVSCDTSDQGCDGGNPITALDYLTNWALATEAAYPYSEEMFALGGPAPLCNDTLRDPSFPFVKSYVTYETEADIALALQRGPLTALVDSSKVRATNACGRHGCECAAMDFSMLTWPLLLSLPLLSPSRLPVAILRRLEDRLPGVRLRQHGRQARPQRGDRRPRHPLQRRAVLDREEPLGHGVGRSERRDTHTRRRTDSMRASK